MTAVGFPRTCAHRHSPFLLEISVHCFVLNIIFRSLSTHLRFWFFLLFSVALTLLAGLMSGLTLGLMSLDTVELEVLKRSGTRKEKKYAAGIIPLLKRPHLLLVTLLTCK